MNVLSKIFVVLSLCSISFLSIAKEANENATQTIRLVQYRPIPTNTPRMPSFNFIVCKYSLGKIEFDLPDTMEYIEIEICNQNVPIWTGIIYSDDSYIEIPILSGDYSIYCTTNDGQTYFGTLSYL